MGRVLEVSEMALNTAMFGDSSSYMGDYLQHQMDQMHGNGMAPVNEVLYNSLQTSYDYINDGIRQFQIMQELESTQLKTLEEYITYYDGFESIQKANLPTQRYIMAEPTIREIYLNGNCDGYSGSYNSIFDEGIGEEHYDYRRVTNGILWYDDEEDECRFVRYIDDLIEDDRELNIVEQDNILQTWRVMNNLMRESEYDFTKDSARPEYMMT